MRRADLGESPSVQVFRLVDRGICGFVEDRAAANYSKLREGLFGAESELGFQIFAGLLAAKILSRVQLVTPFVSAVARGMTNPITPVFLPIAGYYLIARRRNNPPIFKLLIFKFFDCCISELSPRLVYFTAQGVVVGMPTQALIER